MLIIGWLVPHCFAALGDIKTIRMKCYLFMKDDGTDAISVIAEYFESAYWLLIMTLDHPSEYYAIIQ